MTNADKVRGFLDFSGPQGWDPSLMGVMAGAVGFNLISFRLLRHWQVTPVCLAPPPSSSSAEEDAQGLHKAMKYGAAPENLAVNWKLVLGATIFGVGWGMGGKHSHTHMHMHSYTCIHTFTYICTHTYTHAASYMTAPSI